LVRVGPSRPVHWFTRRKQFLCSTTEKTTHPGMGWVDLMKHNLELQTVIEWSPWRWKALLSHA